VANTLPPRPNLDHLRRQAKSLLADLQTGDKQALATMSAHLPAAKQLSDEQIRTAGFRLADAQSAIARKTGFANWPQLARHVEQLRALEGTWEIETLEIDGRAMSLAMLTRATGASIKIDGDRFRSEMTGETYDGTFNIDVEADPHHIDLEFVEGPEAGNFNYGIYRIDGDRFTLCLDMNGKARPQAFATAPGSGHALETLRRASDARPDSVTGGVPQSRAQAASKEPPPEFAFVPSPTLSRLQGEWSAVRLVKDGQEPPAFMIKSGRRSATNNEVKVSYGGKLMVHVLVRIDETVQPTQIDYYNLLPGPFCGLVQRGIMKWIGDEVCICFADPGQPRPTDFTSTAGSGLTLSQWRRC